MRSRIAGSSKGKPKPAFRRRSLENRNVSGVSCVLLRDRLKVGQRTLDPLI